ncbi:MAG TPA: hypothetical protein VF796_04825, partial [Humisphaera sp.]
AAALRLREGPLLFCSFTDQAREWKTRKGLPFKDAAGDAYTGYGLFAALSFDDGKTWPVTKLVTPGDPPDGKKRLVEGTDGGPFELSKTMAERGGYLCVVQSPDGVIQLVSSRQHYAFNLAWVKEPAR